MIPELFSESRETDVILGPVVQAGMEALKVSLSLATSDWIPGGSPTTLENLREKGKINLKLSDECSGETKLNKY